MFCSHCGTQIEEGANFCKNCGKKVGAGVSPETPPASTSAATMASGSHAAPVAPHVKPGSNAPVIIAVCAVVAMLLGAGIYFGTDLLRQPAKPETAVVASAGPKLMEAPTASGENAPKPPVELLSQSPRSADVAAGASSQASTGGATPGTYHTVRPTSVYDAPSASAKVVANIDSGVPVNVVGSNGDWLEVRSKTGRPPGFIRRGDASLMEPSK